VINHTIYHMVYETESMSNNNSVEIKKSRIEGVGVFSTTNLKKGEPVYSFKKGKVISMADIQNISEQEKRYLDKIGDDDFEIIESPARYVNHSCGPNIAEKERVAYALRDIKKGEEITIDYDEISYFKEPIKCSCGSKNCRGFVRGKK